VIETQEHAGECVKNKKACDQLFAGLSTESLSFLLVPVQLDVTLCCFTGMMRRVQMVPLRGMRMVSRRLVFAGAMMFSCFAVMLSRVFMVFSSLRVMFL
jgi:hypothetical protein